MDNPASLFLIVASIIIVLALLLTWIVQNSRGRKETQEDLNGDRADGDAIATWSGIEHGNDDH